MITEALALVGTVVAGVFWWVKRKAAQRDDARNQIEREREENRQAIEDGDGGDLVERRIVRLPPHGPEDNRN